MSDSWFVQDERSFRDGLTREVAALVAGAFVIAAASRGASGAVGSGGLLEAAIASVLLASTVGAGLLANARQARAAEVLLVGATALWALVGLAQGLDANAALGLVNVFLLATLFWGRRAAMIAAAAVALAVVGALARDTASSAQGLAAVPGSLVLALGIGLFGIDRLRGAAVKSTGAGIQEARAAERRLGQWQALLRLSGSFLASSRPGELAFDAASTLATALRVPMVAVWLRGEDGKLQRKALIGQQDVPPEATDDGIEPSARIARIDRRTELSRRFLGWNETGFLIPIGEASPIRGVIVLVEPVGPLGQDDFELVAAAAGLLASACERADADEAVRASQRLDVTSQLLSGVAHDFNNLITAISSNTDIALSEVPPDGIAAECLQEVVSAAQNAAVLTGRLGAWARPEPLAPARLELSGVLRQNVRLLANLLGKRVQLGIDPGPRGSEVMVDRNDLEQILYNLVLSARNAGPELPNRVDVKVVQGADEVSIVVIDDGPGHASDARSQLYEPFPTPTRGASRASLALATVRRLAARADGRVTIEGGPKATHVVRVRFPRLAEAPAPVVTTPPARRRVRVLLVDDSAPARIAGANALRSGGHHVVEAEDPRAVLETWDNHTDVLVTDLQMRGLSGAELAAAVTARGWRGPILFCTGHPSEAPPLEPGRTALLAKPYTRKEMLQAVDALLGAVAA